MKGREYLNSKWTRIYIERDCYLFPFFTFVKGLGQRIKPFLGENLSPLVVHFSDKGVEYFTPLKLIKELGEKAYDQSLNTDFYEELMELMDQRIFSTLTTCKEIRPNIKTLNEKETIEAIKKISEELLQLNPLGQLLAISEYGPNNYISGDLTELISKKSNSINLKLSASRTSALMTTPIKPTLFRKSSLKLMKLAIFAKKNNYSINDKVLLKELKNYWYNYLWIDYGYTGPTHSFDYFKCKLEALIKKDNLAEEYVHKLIELYTIEKKQYEYEILLDLSKKEKRKFFLARDMGFYKVFRKEITFFAMYLFGELTKNLTDLWDIDEKLFRNVLPEEYDYHTIKRIAKEREKELIYLVNDDSEEIIVGKEAREILRLVKGKKVKPVTKEYHKGSTAHPGKVIGKAKLVMGVNHLSKVQEGDILVSFSTNPQMIIAMGKAKAIITEQGGIACHAAIVAREMKKPCVVGIDDLTQIINDGDLLEVNADEGFVRIIQRHQNYYKL